MNQLHQINWNQLAYFYEVGRSDSLRECAKRLDISPSTLSEHLKNLERFLQTTLFERENRKLKLSKDGKLLYEYCRELFDSGRKILDLFTEKSLGGYNCKVGLIESFSESTILQVVNEYSDLFAPYGIVNTYREWDSERVIDAIQKGVYDWGITTRFKHSKFLEYKEIGSYRIRFLCSKKIFNKFKRKRDLLETLPLAVSSWDKTLNNRVLEYLEKNKIIPQEIIETDHREYALKLAERGRCVTITASDLSKVPKKYEVFTLKGDIDKIQLYAIWRKVANSIVAIKKLKQLIYTDGRPSSYDDQELLIKIAEVPEKILK